MTPKLSSKQHAVLVALLDGLSVPEVVTLTGVSKRQIFRYLADPDFSNSLVDEQELALHVAGVRLAGMIDAALTALSDVLDSPELRGQNVRRLAARDVLELCLKWRDQTELAARLSALEERLSV